MKKDEQWVNYYLEWLETWNEQLKDPRYHVNKNSSRIVGYIDDRTPRQGKSSES